MHTYVIHTAFAREIIAFTLGDVRLRHGSPGTGGDPNILRGPTWPRVFYLDFAKFCSGWVGVHTQHSARVLLAVF